MKALLLQEFTAREPRTPIALMDLAAYGRVRGHHIDVGYSQDAAAISSDYDFVGLSAVGFSRQTQTQLAFLRQRFAGRLILGGKATRTITKSRCRRSDRWTLSCFTVTESICSTMTQRSITRLIHHGHQPTFPHWIGRAQCGKL